MVEEESLNFENVSRYLIELSTNAGLFKGLKSRSEFPKGLPRTQSETKEEFCPISKPPSYNTFDPLLSKPTPILLDMSSKPTLPFEVMVVFTLSLYNVVKAGFTCILKYW